jgi:uncharacterized Tic20 family protein
MINTPSTEERVWAVLSHLSAIALGVGLLIPVLGWSEQRRKSKYASFQCLQALGYQSLGYTVWFLFILVVVIVGVVLSSVILVAIEDSQGAQAQMPAAVGIILGILAVALLGVYFLFPLIGAISCALGKDFRYPIMGERLARYLGYGSDDESAWLVEEHEDRWVSAMGHISVIIPLWGILAPLSVWILQGKRNAFLKLQAVQTVVYQVIVNLMYLVSNAIPLFGVLILFAFTGLESGPTQPTTPLQMIGIAAFIISMLVFMVIILIVPLFHILGQWAGYSVLKGDDYRYPLAGRWAERWMAKYSTETPKLSDDL